jgi:hypothetical protein
LPCTRGNSTPCTNEQEVTLFTQSLKERLAAIASGEAEWLEFYPGSFGDEAKWPNWTAPRTCKPERVHECVDNTIAMRSIVRKILNPQFGPA